MKDLLLAYYGDDFTGSADVTEALARTGLHTVLFLKPPTQEALARYPDLRAFGIAGGSRTMSPEEMERELPRHLQRSRRAEPTSRTTRCARHVIRHRKSVPSARRSS